MCNIHIIIDCLDCNNGWLIYSKCREAAFLLMSYLASYSLMQWMLTLMTLAGHRLMKAQIRKRTKRKNRNVLLLI